MEEFTQFRKKKLGEMRPYKQGEDLSHVSINDEDKAAGSPKEGDMIARNPDNHKDQWLVSAQFVADNYVPI